MTFISSKAIQFIQKYMKIYEFFKKFFNNKFLKIYLPLNDRRTVWLSHSKLYIKRL